jgi:acyl-coenzyme A synthetase/AMP-(fatty) acid ligase/acyl carrier protein
VVNLYGPTEATIEASYWRGKSWPENNVPIGKPIANAQVYVLDEQMGPRPVGVPGELYIGGAGLARGYINRPGLTAERFVPNPFGRQTGQRLYRTGDRVRWRAGGELEFLGRFDEQVKLRGYRIELGEIETILERHEAVRRAAVTIRQQQNGDPWLVAYVAYAAGAAVSEQELRKYLGAHLPDYMVPALYVGLDDLPLTPSGKVDRRRLPEPERRQAAYRAPSKPGEAQLCAIFAEVLGLERVGMDDNFFALGGHSLMATRLVSRIQARMGFNVPLRSVFEFPTVAELFAQIAPVEPSPSPTVVYANPSAVRRK